MKQEDILPRLIKSAESEMSDREKEFLVNDICNKTRDGWTPLEIFSTLVLTEHVTPSLSEDFAIKRMYKIHQAVFARLGLDTNTGMPK